MIRESSRTPKSSGIYSLFVFLLNTTLALSQIWQHLVHYFRETTRPKGFCWNVVAHAYIAKQMILFVFIVERQTTVLNSVWWDMWDEHVFEESTCHGVLSILCENSAARIHSSVTMYCKGDRAKSYDKVLLGNQFHMNYTFSMLLVVSKSLQVKWWNTKARLDHANCSQLEAHAQTCGIGETHGW